MSDPDARLGSSVVVGAATKKGTLHSQTQDQCRFTFFHKVTVGRHGEYALNHRLST